MISSFSLTPYVSSRNCTAPRSGSSASTVSIASRTLARIGAMCVGAALPRPAWARDPARRREQRVERDAFERIGRERPERLLGPGGARRPMRLALCSRSCSTLRRVLERLALEQPREQQVALLEAHQLLVEIDVVAAGQQPARLQLDERRRDQQELGGDVEVDALHALDLGAERVDDARERDLPEVDLLLQDQVQEEVERAFEDRGRDLVRHGCQITRAESQACGTASVTSGNARWRRSRPVT